MHGGQLWSLATEGKKGISSAPSDILTPLTIDPNYVPGFVWTRQYGFRVVKSTDHAAFGIAVENPQLLYTASLAGNEPYAVLGSAGSQRRQLQRILAVVTLGYLGLGIQPPAPDWGSMISDGQNFIQTNQWMAAIPGMAVVLTGVGLSLLGDGLADILRPE